MHEVGSGSVTISAQVTLVLSNNVVLYIATICEKCWVQSWPTKYTAIYAPRRPSNQKASFYI